MSGALKRADAATLEFMKRTPTDVLRKARGRILFIELPALLGCPAIEVTIKVGAFVKTSLHTTNLTVADMRHGVVKAHVLRFFDAIRAGPQALSPRNLSAISADVYDHLVELHGDNPGLASNWMAIKGFCRAVREGRVAVAPRLRPSDRHANEVGLAREMFGIELTDGINARPECEPSLEALEHRFGLLATWVLQRRGLEIDAASRRLLLDKVAVAVTRACERLKQHAADDYGPDRIRESFPTFRTDLTLTDLFERWTAATKPSASTIMTWRGYMRQLGTFLGHDRAADLTKADLDKWTQASIEKGRSARTVRDGHLTAVKAVFGWAVGRNLLPANPAIGVVIRVRQKAGDGMLCYSDDDVDRLLTLARHETNPARRWLPWLAATSGARIAEVAQLWGVRVKTVDGVPVMAIAPAEDGGSLKNAQSERILPLHPALLNDGFLQFVESKGGGPLFYGQSTGRGTRRHAAKGVSNHLASWIRTQGFTNARIAPNHGLRAWFKVKLEELGVSDRIADRLQGHGARSAAAGYLRTTLERHAAVVAMIPTPSAESKA